MSDTVIQPSDIEGYTKLSSGVLITYISNGSIDIEMKYEKIFVPDHDLYYKILVDIQPYSSGEAKMDYGIDTKVTNIMFADVNEWTLRLQVGGEYYVQQGGFIYDVKQSIIWDDHVEILLERR